MLISFLLSVSSCQRIKNIKNGLDVMSDSGKVLNNALQLFDDRDVDGLYDLFSVEAKKDEFLKDRIELLMYYCDMIDLDGSNTKIIGASGGKSADDGIITFYDDGIRVENYYDASGNWHYIGIRCISVDKNNPLNEGLYNITLNYNNTSIYSTKLDEKHRWNESNTIDNIQKREKEVINKIENAKKDSAYIQSDDEGRMTIMHSLLVKIIKDENKLYGNSVIAPESIQDIETSDSVTRFPAIELYFIDGGSFVVLVHNHPSR